MFSKEFMFYLNTYGKEVEKELKKETVKEIEFKHNYVGQLAYVLVKIQK